MDERNIQIKKLRKIIHKVAEDLTDEIFEDIINNGMAYESIKNSIETELGWLCEDTGTNDFLTLLIKTKGIVTGIDD